MTTALIYLEDGINWAWFTELELSVERSSVAIKAHYRLHWGAYDGWPERCKLAQPHDQYYGAQRWRTDESGAWTHYYVPLDDIELDDGVDASPSLRLIRHLERRVLETRTPVHQLDAPTQFPDFHMHDKQQSTVTRVDRSNWHDYLNVLHWVDLESWIEENPDRWLVVTSRTQEKEETDLSVYQKCLFCYYASPKAQYTVWSFTASTGIMFDSGRSAIDTAAAQLAALLDLRLHENALRSVSDEVVD